VNFVEIQFFDLFQGDIACFELSSCLLGDRGWDDGGFGLTVACSGDGQGDQGLYKKLMIKSDHEKNLLYGCECFRLECSLSIYPFVGSGSFRRPFDGMAAES